jgi:DnaJ family protein C protein 27
MNNQFHIKLISMGDVEVGKSCLIKRYCEGHFIPEYITTIGIDYGVKKIEMNDSVLAINIFDLSGDDDYKIVRKQYYADALGVLMVYDVNIKTTFDSLAKWEKEAESCGLDLSKCAVVVIGNKTDYKKEKREVKADTAKEWAKSRGYLFFETSAKTSSNVAEAFKYIFEGIYNKTIEHRSKYLY